MHAAIWFSPARLVGYAVRATIWSTRHIRYESVCTNLGSRIFLSGWQPDQLTIHFSVDDQKWHFLEQPQICLLSLELSSFFSASLFCCGVDGLSLSLFRTVQKHWKIRSHGDLRGCRPQLPIFLGTVSRCGEHQCHCPCKAKVNRACLIMRLGVTSLDELQHMPWMDLNVA